MALKFKQGRTQFLIDALQPDRLTRIVDVGANPINDNPYKPLLDMGACEVYGFEPHPEAYAQLLENKGDREVIGDEVAKTYVNKVNRISKA